MRKNRIRILHVAQAAGGVERYIRMLLKYLDKEKFENILVCSQDFREEDYDGLVDSFEQIELNRAIGANDLRSIVEIRKLVKKYNPDIVYAHSSKAGAITRVADIGLKNHCVYNPHGWAFNMRCSDKKRMMYTAIEKIAALFCDKIICISDAEKQSALDKKICREDKLQVIFNGVDIESYESGARGAIKRRDLNIPKDAFVVGMVGRISPQKAPDVFVKMAKQVKDEVPNAHFIIVGKGNQEDEIRKYAEDNGLSDNLHITGWVDNPMSYVELFDVACLLSRWEGFGLVLPEYMMASKPIVASKVGGTPIGEYELVCKIADLVGKDNLLVKTHPRDLRTIYNDNGFNVDKNSSIPWEAVQLGGDFSNHIFLTVNSGSVLAGSFMSEKPVRTFYMYKLCNIEGNSTCQKNAKDIEALLTNENMKEILSKVSIANRLEEIVVG